MRSDFFARPIADVPNVATIIADRLETAILSGELKPGKRLVQEDLASAFGVSRLPVRDALFILEQRDLVEQVPRKGHVVRRINAKMVQDLFAVRRLLDVSAAGEACQHCTPADLDRLEAIVARQVELTEAGDFLALLALDQEFHTALYAPCPNDELKALIAHVWKRVRHIRAHSREVPDWPQRSLAGHRHILDTLRRRDRAALEQQVRAAIDRTEEEILGWLAADHRPGDDE